MNVGNMGFKAKVEMRADRLASALIGEVLFIELKAGGNWEADCTFKGKPAQIRVIRLAGGWNAAKGCPTTRVWTAELWEHPGGELPYRLASLRVKQNGIPRVLQPKTFSGPVNAARAACREWCA